jgi:branched-chain amino acid transport system substrate-binding protein
VYVVDNKTIFGRGVSGVFEVTARDQGLEIISHDSFDEETITAQELKALAARVVEAQPDLLYYGGGVAPRGSEFVGAVRALNPDLQIMGPDGMAQEQLITDIGAELVEGVYGTNVAIPADQLESAAAAAFLKNYQSIHDKEPVPYVVSSYEAMKVLLHAIEQAKEPTRQGVLTAIADLDQFSGVFGDWRFNAQGDISLTTISGLQVQDGVWSFVQVIQ